MSGAKLEIAFPVQAIPGPRLVDANGYDLLPSHWPASCDEVRHIVASINRCKSIPTEALESNVIRELVGVVQDFADSTVGCDLLPRDRALVKRALAVLSKIGGAECSA